MEKIALIGDSIFDNEAYVASDQAVIDQINLLAQDKKKDESEKSCAWSPNATLLAVDGAITEDVANQCKGINALFAEELRVSVNANTQ